MAIPKKGARRISVDGVRYRWLIRGKATYGQTDYGSGRLHVAVERAESPGTTLILYTDRPHPKDWATSCVIPITPSDVAAWIRKSIEQGWQPAAKGMPLMLKVEGSSLRRSPPSAGFGNKH